jgi:hypothetical protein
MALLADFGTKNGTCHLCHLSISCVLPGVRFSAPDLEKRTPPALRPDGRRYNDRMPTVAIEHIEVDESGTARVPGTRSRVINIVLDTLNGLTPAQIHEAYPHQPVP